VGAQGTVRMRLPHFANQRARSTYRSDCLLNTITSTNRAQEGGFSQGYSVEKRRALVRAASTSNIACQVPVSSHAAGAHSTPKRVTGSNVG
jgi:hypothetical protein